MDIYKVKWTGLQSEIFRLLCIRAGTSLNLREISRALKKTPTAVSNALEVLKGDSVIKVEKSKAINLLDIRFNRENPKAVDLKRVENLKIIYESGIVNFLIESFPGCTIILFGSYSKGEDTITSDIDIAVIGIKKREIDLDKFDKLFEKKIILNFYNSFKEIHKHLLNNILNGILLHGGVEL